eukprot:9015917-Pyramimonas_sp.AAC.1
MLIYNATSSLERRRYALTLTQRSLSRGGVTGGVAYVHLRNVLSLEAALRTYAYATDARTSSAQAALVAVRIHDGEVARTHALEDATLGAAIGGHVAVALQVVRGEVQHHARLEVRLPRGLVNEYMRKCDATDAKRVNARTSK